MSFQDFRNNICKENRTIVVRANGNSENHGVFPRGWEDRGDDGNKVASSGQWVEYRPNRAVWKRQENVVLGGFFNY